MLSEVETSQSKEEAVFLQYVKDSYSFVALRSLDKIGMTGKE